MCVFDISHPCLRKSSVNADETLFAAHLSHGSKQQLKNINTKHKHAQMVGLYANSGFCLLLFYSTAVL